MAQQPTTVVCIEDEPGVIELIRLILERRGLTVLGAENGSTGLDMIRQSHPALVLLDLMLPGMDGWEIYRRMKADETMKHIPVIILQQGLHNLLASSSNQGMQCWNSTDKLSPLLNAV